MVNCEILEGDCVEILRRLPGESVHCCVTSPPYWGLRDYGVAGQIGLEPTPQEYVAKMVEVFREVRRVLRGDGTCWVNLGDSFFNSNPGSGGNGDKSGLRKDGRDESSRIKSAKLSISHQTFHSMESSKISLDSCRSPVSESREIVSCDGAKSRSARLSSAGLKPKDLCGIPWRVAFALQADGWWLRQDIIWAKPNPMPESVTDRCTKAHEYMFLLTKSANYFYDAESIKEQSEELSGWARQRAKGENTWKYNDTPERIAQTGQVVDSSTLGTVGFRNKRSVWTVPTAPFKGAHFATFPPDLIKPCILAGCPVGGTVLDPFGGSGTTGQVALELGRNAILIELNPEYVKLANDRTFVTPGLQF